MSKFKTDMRVFVIDENNEVRKGVINVVYEAMEIAIVKFDDGNVEKVNVNCLGICREEPTKTEPSEPVEKSEITITRDEFKKALAKSVSPTTLIKLSGSEDLSPMMLLDLALSGIVIGKSLEKVLFEDYGEDD